MEFRSVMVPVNGQESDVQAVELACTMLKPGRGTIYMLYVIEMGRAQPVDADVPQDTVNQGEEVLRRLEALAREGKRQVEGDVVQARSAGAAIVAEAVTREVEAIVMAMPYKQRFGVFSLGDTVPHILKNAPCRVLLVRSPVTEGALSDGQREAVGGRAS